MFSSQSLNGISNDPLMALAVLKPYPTVHPEVYPKPNPKSYVKPGGRPPGLT